MPPGTQSSPKSWGEGCQGTHNHTFVHIYIYIHTYMCIERERERERKTDSGTCNRGTHELSHPVLRNVHVKVSHKQPGSAGRSSWPVDLKY